LKAGLANGLRDIRRDNSKRLYFPYVSRKTRIMAAMPQFSRLRIKQRAKKNLAGSERWRVPPEFLESAPSGELKELILLVLGDVNR
jgi:hypothetical protein